MAVIKNILALFFILLNEEAMACPACLTSSSSRPIEERLFLIALMGLLPLGVAVFVGFRIYFLCRSIPKKAK